MSVSPNQPEHSNNNRPAMDDEIDLFELWENIWRQRVLVVVITALVTLVGAGYAFLATPIYKSETYLLPPLSQDLQQLQVNVEDFAQASSSEDDVEVGINIDVGADKVFERVVQNLRSWSYRRAFYQAHDLAAYFSENSSEQATTRSFENNFNEKLVLSAPDKDESNRYILSFEMADQQQVAKWLNEYVSYVLTQTKSELITDVESNIQQRKTEIEMMISSMRNIAAKKRQDRIAELEEALALAKSIGLENIQQSQSPVPEKEYLRGTKAIEAEIAVLTARKFDDPFIEGIRDLQRYYDYLSSIQIDPEAIQVARVDQAANIPQNPIKPNKKLILVLSLLLGGMLGVFVALIRSAIKNRRADFT